MIIPSAKTRIIKVKRCRACGNDYFPSRPLQKACSPDCALALAKVLREKKAKAEEAADRRATKEKLERIKPRSQWLREAQAAFNAYIRARDAGSPCISCGRHHDGQWHAGHYLSTGARPELRFDEANVHKQCQPCNTHLHGNLVMYRLALIKKIGLEAVERLEGPHAPAKLSIDDLKSIKQTYSRMARDLQGGK